MKQDTFDMKFYDLLRTRKFDDARANLAARVEQGEASLIMVAKQTASILSYEGKLDEAIATLTSVIDDGSDPNQLCRFSRADLYLEQGRLSQAEQDYRAVLTERFFITQRFHSSAAFRVAWIKALRGDPSYKGFLDRFPTKESFIVDRIIRRADIDAVYERRSKATS